MTKPTPLITLGDLAQVGADALLFPTDSRGVDSVVEGKLHQAFREIPGFLNAYQKAHKAFLQPKKQTWLQVGDAFWVPLVGDRPRGVVVVAVVVEFYLDGGAFRVGQNASTCMEAALECALKHLPPLNPSDQFKPYVIASPAILLGRGGGDSEPERVAKEQLEAASRVMQKFPSFDALFVLYTDRDLRLFLDARKQLGLVPELAAALAEPIEKLAQDIATDESALFIGAGFSQGAGLPGYFDVIKTMADDLGVPLDKTASQDTFVDIAQWYRYKHHKDHTKAVKRLLDGLLRKRSVLPSPAHFQLLSLPIRHIVTTNYDSLIEDTLDCLRRSPVTVRTPEDISQTGGQGVYTIKLHGDLDEKSGEDVVLSRDDYDHFFEDRPLMAALLQGLLLNRTFLFVGYSLRDPNFRIIFEKLSRQLSSARRHAYVLSFDTFNEHELGYWQRRGVSLISFPTPQERNLRIFLDQVGERIFGHRRLLLAEGVDEETPLLNTLRQLAQDLLNRELKSLDSDQARVAVRALELLASEGWRTPAGVRYRTISHMATALAESVTSEEKRAVLLLALQWAESRQQADMIRRRLAAPVPTVKDASGKPR